MKKVLIVVTIALLGIFLFIFVTKQKQVIAPDEKNSEVLEKVNEIQVIKKDPRVIAVIPSGWSIKNVLVNKNSQISPWSLSSDFTHRQENNSIDIVVYINNLPEDNISPSERITYEEGVVFINKIANFQTRTISYVPFFININLCTKNIDESCVKKTYEKIRNSIILEEGSNIRTVSIKKNISQATTTDIYERYFDSIYLITDNSLSLISEQKGVAISTEDTCASSPDSENTYEKIKITENRRNYLTREIKDFSYFTCDEEKPGVFYGKINETTLQEFKNQLSIESLD